MRAQPLGLRPGDRELLESWTRSSSIRAGLAQRARIVLLAADGVSNNEIAERVGVARPTVNLWRERYAEPGWRGWPRSSGRVGRGRWTGRRSGGDVDAAAGEAGGDALVVAAARRPAGGGCVHGRRGSGRSTGSSRGRRRRSSSPPTPSWSPRSPTSSGCIWRRRRTRSCSASTRNPVRHEALV